jgi:antitoxin component of MazEF toxin-antitoxin module
MLRRRITTSGNSAALILSQDLLGLLGIEVGDEVDLEIIDHTLLVRPVVDTDRVRKIMGAMDDALVRRRRLLRRLAEGDATPGKKKRT